MKKPRDQSFTDIWLKEKPHWLKENYLLFKDYHKIQHMSVEAACRKIVADHPEWRKWYKEKTGRGLGWNVLYQRARKGDSYNEKENYL